MNKSVATDERFNSRDKGADALGALVSPAASGGTLQTAQRLEQVVRNTERFLVEHLRQLDALLAQRPQAAEPDGSTRAERATFLQRQLAWDRQRNEELQRIEREREQLAEAWARLEADQRRLLAEEALWRAEANAKHDATPNLTPDAASEAAGNSRPGGPRTRQLGSGQSQAMSRESALVDYEQLKSDVQKHARRIRRGK